MPIIQPRFTAFLTGATGGAKDAVKQRIALFLRHPPALLPIALMIFSRISQ
jgi:hypothetical protein